MTTKQDIWLTLHYESGQISMNRIRGVFRDLGYDLGHQEPDPGSNGMLLWGTLANEYLKRFPGSVEAQEWSAFRKATTKMNLHPMPVGTLHMVPEARSRMATTGHPIRWKSVNLGGFAYPPAFEGDVGLDLAAAEDMVAYPDRVTYVPTGVAFAAPVGYWILLLGRSSTASKLGLTVVPGVIDNGYRGEMLAGVVPMGPDPVRIAKGTRIIQAIMMPVISPVPEQVEWLPPSDRGNNGFGSTGGHTQ